MNQLLQYHAKEYTVIHEDRKPGSTTAKKIWTDVNDGSSNRDEGSIDVKCNCCTTYKQWTVTHPILAKQLQKEADNTLYYQVYPDEDVKVVLGGRPFSYTGTIRASAAAPKGACKGSASNVGSHPFICDACNALTCGKSSQLNRLVNRASTLKHPRSDKMRATKPGVNHKHLSSSSLQIALHVRKVASDTSKVKIDRLQEANQKLLSQSWHSSPSVRPFVETFITLLQQNKLSNFDHSFLQNWLKKKLKGRFYSADEQARKLAILYSNKLGEKMYTSTAPLLGLLLARQARRIRSKEIGDKFYLPGINDWALELAAQQECRPLQNGMDGTRVIRVVELYHDQYLVGKAFPPDIRCFPSPDELVQAISWQQIQDHVLQVRDQGAYAAEAYSFNLSDTTGKLPDMLTGSIPESRIGVSGEHILALMLEFERKALKYTLPLIGHCTDSASNALNALILLASPSTYNHPTLSLSFLGLRRDDYYYFAPFLRSTYPSIAYPCWDHSSRTVLRNLMNTNLTIVSGKHENAHTSGGFQHYTTADIQDLRKLKMIFPTCSIKFADITPQVKQNCDATTRVINRKVFDDLKQFVPGSEGTQLYLLAATSTHEPYRNDQFGPPPVVTRSLWKGLMIWRRWRRYIQLTDDLLLTKNFISRSHYMTEELLVHAGINHQLALYLCFPYLPIHEYSLRNTGNRGLEAIHGIFRGGTSSLPITSPNLSFAEFLTKMNKSMQICSVEHYLKRIEGNNCSFQKEAANECTP